VNDYFSIQSTSKPITYAVALEERGQEFVHDFVGAPLPRPLPAYVCSKYAPNPQQHQRHGLLAAPSLPVSVVSLACQQAPPDCGSVWRTIAAPSRTAV